MKTQIKRALVFTKKTSTLVTKGRTLLQIEKKGRASLGQGWVLRPVKTTGARSYIYTSPGEYVKAKFRTLTNIAYIDRFSD
jgi:hypothetical protein